MESRQSDARNKIIAPIFKHIGIIDQWGNGLKLIADELKDYPLIQFTWKEIGLSFQIQFIKLDYVAKKELGAELGVELGVELGAELGAELKQPTLYSKILQSLYSTETTKQELANSLGLENISGYMNRTIKKLLDQDLIERTIPKTLNHPAQKFRLTKRGGLFLELLKEKQL